VILAGRRILVTGVVNRHSIAYAVAAAAQREGAEVLLSSFGRVRRMTERAAGRLDPVPGVIELDVNDEDDLGELPERVGEHWDSVDGVVHAIAHAPPEALGGGFVSAPRGAALAAFETSAYSLKAVAERLEPMMGEGGAIVGLDFDASRAWPAYDWMGVAKAGLEAVSRYLARDLGPSGIRANLVAAGPIATPASSGIPGFGDLAAHWERAAPLGWDTEDPAPVADAVLFLLSDLSRGVSGQILHADGGASALAALS
jgi:meromycolic acid enoyl-[acyl-carrier protein] reductase